MQVEIIKINSEGVSLDSTRQFGVTLKKIHSSIHLLHWYAADINVHEILGDLYASLDGLFDKLQEEIIGTSRIQNSLFPNINSNIDIEDINQYKGDAEDILSNYKKVNEFTQNLLTSLEFNNYITTVKSGINNTKEDILSSFNKANYLLSLVNL
jgi:DNA-binding ferritin-like protein